MNIQQKRIAKYREASEVVQDLYSNPESGEIMHGVFQKHSLQDNHYKIYANCIGDVILGFYSKSQLSQLLMEGLGIQEEKANAVAIDLADFLAPIEDIALTQDSHYEPKVDEKIPVPVKATPKEVPENPEPKLDKIRTMEDDAKKITGYKNYVVYPDNTEPPTHSSSQDEIFKGKSSLAGTPSYKE